MDHLDLISGPILSVVLLVSLHPDLERKRPTNLPNINLERTLSLGPDCEYGVPHRRPDLSRKPPLVTTYEFVTHPRSCRGSTQTDLANVPLTHSGVSSTFPTQT